MVCHLIGSHRKPEDEASGKGEGNDQESLEDVQPPAVHLAERELDVGRKNEEGRCGRQSNRDIPGIASGLGRFHENQGR
jgi:hypothetical protein